MDRSQAGRGSGVPKEDEWDGTDGCSISRQPEHSVPEPVTLAELRGQGPSRGNLDEAAGEGDSDKENSPEQERMMETSSSSSSSVECEYGEDERDIFVAPVVLKRPNPSEAEASDSRGMLQRQDVTSKTKRMKACMQASAPNRPNDLEYNMNHKRRGKALIFDHTLFHPSQSLTRRPGSDADRVALEKTFGSLDFEVVVYSDYTRAKLLEVLRTVALEDHNDADCIAVIILTHGKTGVLHAYDEEYPPEILWDVFTPDKCPTLAGKPKMFFIQACRGELYDEGITLRPQSSRTVVDGPRSAEKPYRIPNQADFLMVFSTAPGFYSWRNSRNGGCFIQALCGVLDSYGLQFDLLTNLTIVNREVAINYESNVPKDMTQSQKKQVPHVTHTLLRQIKFSPKRVLDGSSRV